MTANIDEVQTVNQRVRAILLTGNDSVLFIKRVKPHKPQPYWVAPGGGVENEDNNLIDTLDRELSEELGATATILDKAFILEHEKGGKQLEEHFFICRLNDYDLSKRNGPEFNDPSRGEFIPEEVALDPKALHTINIKTPEMRDWIIDNMGFLRDLQSIG